MVGSTLLITAVFFAFLVAGAISLFLTYKQTNKVVRENSLLADEVESQKKKQQKLQEQYTIQAKTLCSLREKTEEQQKTLSKLKERLVDNVKITELKNETESLRENINDIKGMTDDELRAWVDVQMTESHIFTDPDLNLKGMAQRLGLTQKKIKQLLKDSDRYERLYDYLTEKRVLYSCELIKKNPQWSMEAIGKEAGFVSRSTFQTEFKKRIGITPAQYRQNNLNEVVRVK